MPEAATTFDVREVADAARLIEVKGEITAQSEDVLMDAYGRANDPGIRAIILDFGDLDYMNSGGIGLLVTLLVRAQRAHQRVLAFGLSDHYRQIFELTRLDEAVGIHDSETHAVAAIGGGGTTMNDQRTELPTGEPAAARDPAAWAKSVSRLNVSDVPA